MYSRKKMDPTSIIDTSIVLCSVYLIDLTSSKQLGHLMTNHFEEYSIPWIILLDKISHMFRVSHTSPSKRRNQKTNDFLIVPLPQRNRSNHYLRLLFLQVLYDTSNDVKFVIMSLHEVKENDRNSH